jgi:hypothetical protein
MMKKIFMPFLFLALLIASCAHHRQGDFVLIDSDTGTQHGPFRYLHSETVKLDNKSYVLSKLDSRDKILEDKLRRWTIPVIGFEHADIRDVIQYLNDHKEWRLIKSSEELRKDPLMETILVLPDGYTTHGITLTMTDASLYEVLRAVARATRSKFYILNGHPYIEPREIRPMTPEDIKAREEADPF